MDSVKYIGMEGVSLALKVNRTNVCWTPSSHRFHSGNLKSRATLLSKRH